MICIFQRGWRWASISSIKTTARMESKLSEPEETPACSKPSITSQSMPSKDRKPEDANDNGVFPEFRPAPLIMTHRFFFGSRFMMSKLPSTEKISRNARTTRSKLSLARRNSHPSGLARISSDLNNEIIDLAGESDPPEFRYWRNAP
ncbi:hypothetical protein D3C81_1452590 [compost metagenome]